MSQFLSNKYLKYRDLAHVQPRLIATDTLCVKCDYNLRGLLSSSNCPECGAAVKKSLGVAFSTLSEAPLEDIEKLRRGLWAGTWCLVLGLPVVVLTTWVTHFTGVGFIVLSLLWIAAVFRMLPVLKAPEGKSYGFRSGSRLREFARWSQVGWLVAFAALAAGPIGSVWGVVAVLSILVGLAGLVAIAVLLERLGRWSCNESASAKMNFTVFFLPLTTAVIFLCHGGGSPGRLFFLLRGLSWFGWVVALIAFAWALLSLTRSTSWAGFHARQRIAKDEERGAKIVRRTPVPLPPADEPIPLSDPDDPIPHFGLEDPKDPVTIAMDVIARDVYCDCGYNLRGLKTYGRCPECGERVASA